MRKLKTIKAYSVFKEGDDLIDGREPKHIVLGRAVYEYSLEEAYNEFMSTIKEEDIISCERVGDSYHVEYMTAEESIFVNSSEKVFNLDKEEGYVVEYIKADFELMNGNYLIVDDNGSRFGEIKVKQKINNLSHETES